MYVHPSPYRGRDYVHVYPPETPNLPILPRVYFDIYLVVESEDGDIVSKYLEVRSTMLR
jgi:hypothetical protein